jgi:arylformamidase
MERNWIDISVPLRTGMVHWPGDPGVDIRRVQDMDRGDGNNVSHLSMGAHTGTHMDAPLHFLPNGPAIDQIPLDATVGRARVIGIEHPETITADELRRYDIAEGERILFRTRNSERCWGSETFIQDFVSITEEAARYLADRPVRAVGIDYLSVGGFDADGPKIHRILLEAGIWIIEGLDLSAAPPGNYELVCLPLKITGADGAPARAILRPH